MVLDFPVRGIKGHLKRRRVSCPQTSQKKDSALHPRMNAKVFVVFSALLLGISAQAQQHVDHPDGRSDRYHQQDEHGNFDFGYDVARADGSRDSRQERGDVYGNVVGSYSLVDTDGRSRTVDYTAGENGFQAVVRTNEPGTANQSPAFVTINADPPRVVNTGRQPVHVNPPVSTTARRPYRPAYRPRPTYHYEPHHGSVAGHHSHSHYAYDYPHYNY